MAGDDALSARIFRNFTDAPIDATSWNELVDRCDTGTVFQTYEWLTSWWNTFGSTRQLLLIAIYRNHQVIGLAPLVIEKTRFGSRIVKFLGDGNADYCDFITPHGFNTSAVVDAILQALGGVSHEWDKVCLSNIPESSGTLTDIAELCTRHELRLLELDATICPTLVIHGHEEQATSILRKDSLRRPYNHFRTHGSVEFRDLVDPNEAQSHLQTFFEQHIERWRNTPFPSLFHRESNRAFYAELLARMLPTGRLMFSVLKFNDDPIAYHFGFEYKKKYIWYKPSFAIIHSKKSPGTLLLRYLIERALQHRCHEFDFTIGDEVFKRRYANAVRRNRHIWMFSGRSNFLLNRLLVWSHHIARKLAK